MAQTKREPEGYQRLTAALGAFADPARAAQEKRYQKSSWEHWGVALPKMDAAIRATVADFDRGDSLALAARLWREPVWDLRIVAGRILARKVVAPDADVWAFVMRRMGDLDGWAVADNLASVGGRCLVADPARLDIVESWVESPHLWTRRAALVFTLPWTKDGRSGEIPSACSAGRRDSPLTANGSSRRRLAGGCANSPSATPFAYAASSTNRARR